MKFGIYVTMSDYWTCALDIVKLPQALVACHKAQPCLIGNRSVDEMAADAGWDLRVVASKYWKLKIDDDVRRRVMGEEFHDNHVNVTSHTVQCTSVYMSYIYEALITIVRGRHVHRA